MLNTSKRRRMLGLTLLPITLLLSIAIGSLYLIVQSGYGTTAAFLALTVATVIILGLICKGIQYAAAIEKTIQSQLATTNPPSETKAAIGPFEVETWSHVIHAQRQDEFSFDRPDIEIKDTNPSETCASNSLRSKRRGKQSRFPLNKIKQAVLKWEQRDPQFTSINLTEFLEQEFGCGPDGILLMAPTTFYDWRRRILNDLSAKSEARSNHSGGKTH
jgi:hypothetical protein